MMLEKIILTFTFYLQDYIKYVSFLCNIFLSRFNKIPGGCPGLTIFPKSRLAKKITAGI